MQKRRRLVTEISNEVSFLEMKNLLVAMLLHSIGRVKITIKDLTRTYNAKRTGDKGNEPVNVLQFLEEVLPDMSQ